MKPFSDFTTDKRTNKPVSTCKPCCAARSRAWTRANATYRAEWKRANPQKVKAQRARDYAARRENPAAIAKDIAGSVRWREKNREKHRAYSRQWARDHPDVVRIRQRAWLDANADSVNARSRANKLMRRTGSTPATTEYALSVLLRDPCSYCGGTSSEIDHIQAVARGGTSHWENLTPACRPCNATKNATRLVLWMARRHNELLAAS